MPDDVLRKQVCTLTLQCGDEQRVFEFTRISNYHGVSREYRCKIPGPGNAVITSRTLEDLMDLIHDYNLIDNEMHVVFSPGSSFHRRRSDGK